MGMTIEEVIKDYEQSVTQNKLFIKAHQSMMEPSEIKEYRYYIDRDNLAIDTMRKYQKIEEAYKKYLNDMVTNIYADGKFIKVLKEVLEDGNDN